MNAHLLLHQLLDEYGLRHSSLDESVCEFVVAAMAGQDQDQDQTGQHQTGQDQTGQDQTGQHQTGQHQTGQDQTGQHQTGQHQTGQDKTGDGQDGQGGGQGQGQGLSDEEREELLRAVLPELEALNEEQGALFLQDLVYASKQLLGVSGGVSEGVSEGVSGGADKEFPQLGAEVSIPHTLTHSHTHPSASTGHSHSHSKDKDKEVKGSGVSKSGVGSFSSIASPERAGSGANNNNNNNSNNSSDSRVSGDSTHMPFINDNNSAAKISAAMLPFQKAICKHISPAAAATLTEEVLSYMFEACADSLVSLEDKREVIFACVSDVLGSDSDEETQPVIDRDAAARAVVGVALHMRKMQQQTSKNQARQNNNKQESEMVPPLPRPSSRSPSSPLVSPSPPTPAESVSADAQELHAMLPHLDLAVVQHVLEVKCLHNKLEAAQFLLEHGADDVGAQQLDRERKEHLSKKQALRKEQQDKLAAEEQRRKALIFERYGETEMSRAEFVRAVSRTDNPDVSGSARSKTSGKKGGAGIFNSVTTQTGSNDRVRYRDGVVATYTGEKVIVLKDPKADYDGGSRGTIKTKGKRGPGFIKT